MSGMKEKPPSNATNHTPCSSHCSARAVGHRHRVCPILTRGDVAEHDNMAQQSAGAPRNNSVVSQVGDCGRVLGDTSVAIPQHPTDQQGMGFKGCSLPVGLEDTECFQREVSLGCERGLARSWQQEGREPSLWCPGETGPCAAPEARGSCSQLLPPPFFTA